MCIFILTGCTKTLKDGKQVVKNEETGQVLTENILNLFIYKVLYTNMQN